MCINCTSLEREGGAGEGERERREGEGEGKKEKESLCDLILIYSIVCRCGYHEKVFSYL